MENTRSLECKGCNERDLEKCTVMGGSWFLFMPHKASLHTLPPLTTPLPAKCCVLPEHCWTEGEFWPWGNYAVLRPYASSCFTMKCGLLIVVQRDAIHILFGTSGVWYPGYDFIASHYVLWVTQTNPLSFSSGTGAGCGLCPHTYVENVDSQHSGHLGKHFRQIK